MIIGAFAVPLTVTEDRKRFHSIARGSAMECAAVSDLVLRLDPTLRGEISRTKEVLHSIVSILSSIILK